jgi:hypothetical protein
MTWKEFKTTVEAKGVRDDFKVDYIEVGDIDVSQLDISVRTETKRFRVNDDS